jgi:hypothetical protein
MQLSDCQELPRFGRNLDRKTAPRHGKTLRWPLFAGPYLSDPSSTSRKFETLRKKVSQACQGHQDHRKLTSGAMSTVCGKTDENKEIMLEIRHVFPRRGRLCAQILPYSLQVDPQVQNFKKEDTCSHNMQLSDRQDHPRFGLNLDRKMALRKNTPASIRRAISLGPKLDFSQIRNFKGKGVASFPGTPRSSKTNIERYVNRAREN